MTAVAAYSTHSPSASYDRGATILNYIAGGTVNIGDCVYLDDNNQVQQAIGSASKTAHALGIVVGVTNFYAETQENAGGWVAVCVHGPVYGWVSLIDGQVIYVSKTVAGGMDTAAPSGGVYDFIVGNAVGADAIFVRPGQTTPASV
jgi:hypothetical protein